MSKKNEELVGCLVLGRYRVVLPFAQGGMGAVYLARVEGAAGFSKPVVIKRVLPHLNDARDGKAQFIREARILSNLRHPGIVGVIDFAEERGALLMVLDYVHGYNVAQWLKYVSQTRGKLPWEIALFIMLRVLPALHYAHTFTRSDGSKAGVVHRDVSPGNIVLDIDGNVRLLDFGIALMAEDPGGYKTQDGTFKGKLPYVAPEIYGGETATPMSDVYAAGVVLYQMLSGENPFAAKEMSETVKRVLTLTPPPIASLRGDVPAALDDVIAKAVAKDRTLRYASAEQMAIELRALLPRREDELLSELCELVHQDFLGDMPEAIGAYSLEALDAAWQTMSGSNEFTPLKSSLPPTTRERVLAAQNEPRQSSERVPRVEQRGVSGKQLVLAVLAAALLAGGAVTAALLWTRPPSAPVEQRFLVVEAADRAQGDGKAPAANSEQAAPETLAPSKGVDSGPPGAVSGTPPSVEPRREARAPKAEDEAAALSRAFARKQPAIQACFQAHTQTLEGSPQIAIRFQVDQGGRVTSAAIVPPALAATALGQCLVGVARATDFGAQPEARAFTIPIHARAVK